VNEFIEAIRKVTSFWIASKKKNTMKKSEKQVKGLPLTPTSKKKDTQNTSKKKQE
jgi:hypothetical protein